LETVVELPEQGGGIGLVPVMCGSAGSDRALVVRHKPSAGLNAVAGTYRLPTEPRVIRRGTEPQVDTGSFVLRAVAEVRDHRVWMRTEHDGRLVAETEFEDQGLEFPWAFGLWSSRGGRREISRFTARLQLTDGSCRTLLAVNGGEPGALACWEPRIGHAPRPFSATTIPVLRAPGPGEAEVVGPDLIDLLSNLLLFAPAGALLVVQLGERRQRVLAAALVCAALSFAVEFAQLWIPTRVPSLYDLLCNTLGGSMAAGGVACWLKRRAWSRATE
jgi:hypothetical protein